MASSTLGYMPTQVLCLEIDRMKTQTGDGGSAGLLPLIVQGLSGAVRPLHAPESPTGQFRLLVSA